MWGYMSDYGYGWGGMGFGMLLFWGLFIVGVVMLLKCYRGSGACGKQGRENSALDLLNERYARGEIDKEEFEQKKRDLES